MENNPGVKGLIRREALYSSLVTHCSTTPAPVDISQGNLVKNSLRGDGQKQHNLGTIQRLDGRRHEKWKESVLLSCKIYQMVAASSVNVRELD